MAPDKEKLGINSREADDIHGRLACFLPRGAAVNTGMATERTAQTEWVELLAAIVAELNGATIAVEDALPAGYPGPALYNAMRDYLDRLKALNYGLPGTG